MQENLVCADAVFFKMQMGRWNIPFCRRTVQILVTIRSGVEKNEKVQRRGPKMEKQLVLKTSGLQKKFGRRRAVSNLNMTISEGEIYGFIGRNGAGKTTFMRMIVGTAFPSAGKIELFGGEALSTARRKIGSLIETPTFYPNCTARENMKRFSTLFGGSEEDIERILATVGLADTGRKKVKSFSLGMKQRLGIALALLGHPEFLLLDEPANGLDPTGIKEIRDLILKLNQESGITFLISSHLLDELSKVVTRYGIIDKGVLVEEISREELQEKCRQKLMITVDDPQKALEILSTEIDPQDLSVEDSTIVITSHFNDAALLNQLLCARGVMVSGLTMQSYDLEQYFMERIGE